MIKEILGEILTIFKGKPKKYDKPTVTLSDREIRRLKWEALKSDIFRRANGFCESCGMKLSIYIPPVTNIHLLANIHHKIPKSRGGTDIFGNLECLCPYCHMQRHPKQKNLIAAHIYGKRNPLRVNQKLRWENREYVKVGKIEYVNKDVVFFGMRRFRIFPEVVGVTLSRITPGC